MESDVLLTLLALVAQTPPDAAAESGKWFTLQFNAGDVATVGALIAHYAAIRERLTRLETRVEPMWDSWNLRHSHHRTD